MLVLTRKLGEKIVIKTEQGDVIIHFMPRGKRAGFRIGIEAPKEISIVRSEVLEKDDYDPNRLRKDFREIE